MYIDLRVSDLAESKSEVIFKPQSTLLEVLNFVSFFLNLDFFTDSVSKVTDDTIEPPNSDEMLQEVQSKYESLQKRLSREFYEKYHDWRRTRDAATNDDDEKTLADFDPSKLSPYLDDRNLSPGFKQKFQEWQKLKGLSLSPTRTKVKNENPNTLKKSKSDWHKWRPGSKSESNVLRFLDKEQGESRRELVDGINLYGHLDDRSLHFVSKKQAVDIFTGKPHPPEKKELAWLEKELQKVAREKQRLEKEKEKYAERETRYFVKFFFIHRKSLLEKFNWWLYENYIFFY